ncbi:MAG: hypothetical protein K6A94_12005 [Bacteroidales bacterium]|nr:hypothetical protein [Bacteroidales bacterium]
MKTSLKIFLLAAALIVMTGCSAQRCAERLVRRAVALCPELVQLKAHPIDTVLTAPAFADATLVPMAKVLNGETVYAATDHGTVVVSLRQPDSALRVGFVAAPQKFHYQDTVRLAQVAITEPKTGESHGTRFWPGFLIWIFGIGVGLWIFIYLFRIDIKKQ